MATTANNNSQSNNKNDNSLNYIGDAIKIIEWWTNTGYKIQDIEQVANARCKLSGIFYYVNEYLSELMKDKLFSSYERKRAMFESQAQWDKTAKDTTGKKLLTRDEINCNVFIDNKKLIEQEIQTEANYNKAKLLSESIKEVLAAMSHRIAIARDEYKTSKSDV